MSREEEKAGEERGGRYAFEFENEWLFKRGPKREKEPGANCEYKYKVV